MRKVLAAFGFAVAAASASPASASVTYDLETNLAGFSYVSSDFIKAATSVDAAALSGCGAFLSLCSSVDFAPSAQVGGTPADQIGFNVAFLGFIPFTLTFDFEQGAFGKAGHYLASDGASTLDVVVSAVPLPASAPLFGAAVLALGLAGYGVTRKKAAAAA